VRFALLPAALCVLVVLLVAGCGGGSDEPDRDGATEQAPVLGSQGDDEEAAPGELGFPAFATRNTTRVGGADAIADAAGVAQAVFPSRSSTRRTGASRSRRRS
jgi:hypothetical protein